MNAREHYEYAYRLLRTANTATNHALSPEASESFRNRHTFSTLGAEYRNLVHAARYPRFNPDNRAEIKIRFEYLFWQRHSKQEFMTKPCDLSTKQTNFFMWHKARNIAKTPRVHTLKIECSFGVYRLEMIASNGLPWDYVTANTAKQAHKRLDGNFRQHVNKLRFGIYR